MHKQLPGLAHLQAQIPLIHQAQTHGKNKYGYYLISYYYTAVIGTVSKPVTLNLTTAVKLTSRVRVLTMALKLSV